MNRTHTVATMEVSNATYNEIIKKLIDAGYSHVIDFDNGMLDMSGIGLVRSAEAKADEKACREAYDNRYHKVRPDHSYDEWQVLWAKGDAPGQRLPGA